MEPLGNKLSELAQSKQPSTPNLSVSSDKLAMMTKYARALLGCYRTGEANDPEVYVAAITSVLACYPEEVVRQAVDPASGIPSKIEWLPKPFEVKRELEARCSASHYAAQWDKRAAEQLAERARLDAMSASHPSLEELKAKYGENYGMTVTELPPDENEADRLQRMADCAERSILAWYAALGKEPVRSAGVLISPALVENITGGAR